MLFMLSKASFCIQLLLSYLIWCIKMIILRMFVDQESPNFSHRCAWSNTFTQDWIFNVPRTIIGFKHRVSTNSEDWPGGNLHKLDIISGQSLDWPQWTPCYWYRCLRIQDQVCLNSSQTWDSEECQQLEWGSWAELWLNSLEKVVKNEVVLK